MSYSFQVKAATKAEVASAISAEFAKVVDSQPVHKTDVEQAKAAVSALLDLAFDDPARDIYVSVSGSLWSVDAGVEQVSLNINVAHVARAVAEAAPTA